MALTARVLRAAPLSDALIKKRDRGSFLIRAGIAAAVALLVFTLGWSYGRGSRPHSTENVTASLLWELDNAGLLRVEESSKGPQSVLPASVEVSSGGISSPDIYVAYLDRLGNRRACAGQDFSFNPECF
ncbi:MAG: hypothetical protein ACREQX_14250 [Candidatus Binataceae bacterium]